MRKAMILLTIMSLFLFSSVPLAYGVLASGDGGAEGGPPPFAITDVQLILSSDDQTPPKIGDGGGSFGQNTHPFSKSGDGLSCYVYVSSTNSVVESVSYEFTTPSGNETINAVYNSYSQWTLHRTFSNSDIGTWALNKVVAIDGAGNTAEMTFNNRTFYVFPKNYSFFSDQELICSVSDALVKISLSREVDPATINAQSVLLYETTFYSNPLSFDSYYR